MSDLVLRENRLKKINVKSEKIFFNNLFKIGYSIEKPKYIKKDKYLNFLTKTFQRRFRQELINGKIDQECLLISQNLVKKLS